MFKRIVVPDRALVATCWYVLLACVMTWPVVAHLGTSVPGGLGDPLVSLWAIGWDASHFVRFLTGHWNALSGFWTANIFYPEPLTLAYSDHLIGEAIQILPIYAVTGNLVLCYNLLFLSTFVLSGLGVFLLVRDLTGNGRAAFVTGLLFAFALVRGQQMGHIQSLSSQWMPFVLFGLHRYFVTRRWPPLAGAAAALVLQNLSSGYYLLFFPPFVAAYVVYEMWSHRAMRDRKIWLGLAIAAIAVLALTIPPSWPYTQLPHLGIGSRQAADLDQFSADVYGYLTPYPGLRLWGRILPSYPKLEGCNFAGFLPWTLAAVGLGVAGLSAWRATRAPRAATDRRVRRLASALLAVMLMSALAGVVMLFAGRRLAGLERIAPAAGNVSNYFAIALVALLALLATAPAVRAMFAPRTGRFAAVCFYAAAAACAIWLSFGRFVASWGYPVSGTTAYEWLYRYVPGFSGLRVPSRYAMLATLFLTVVAGFGADAIARRRKWGQPALFLLGAAFLVEAAFLPLRPERVWANGRVVTAAISRADEMTYRYVRDLPDTAVLIEFPFNDDRLFDDYYMCASTTHWRRMVNGRSSFYPPWLSEEMGRALTGAPKNPEAAWRALLKSGATHAIVHEALYGGREGTDATAWLRSGPSREVFAVGPDHVFELHAESGAPLSFRNASTDK